MTPKIEELHGCGGWREKMKHDNRGMSLIELVIAMAVSTVIMGVIIVFITTATRSYNSAQNSIDLQMESHVMMEQISAWIMEGNNVRVEPIDINGESVDALVIYRIPRQVPEGRLPIGVEQDTACSRRIIWMQGKRLYMTLKEQNTLMDPDDPIVVSELSADDEHCICEYMMAFTPTWDASVSTVKIAVTLKAGTQEYQLENEFKVRNEIL